MWDQCLNPSSHWPVRDAEHIIPDLHICEGAWQSAESQPDIVHSLLDEELQEGWISEYASLEDIQSAFPQVALGRLGLVLAEGRSARLVVDSSISGVTSSSAIPNCISNPRIEDVSSCAPSYVPSDPWVGASIDVKKAHRRMLIAKHERALLAFSFRGRYFISNCLNFGARASSWYWSRLAGCILRLSHHLIFLKHLLWVYVDDFLAAFQKATTPLHLSLWIMLLLCIRLPISWSEVFNRRQHCLDWLEEFHSIPGLWSFLKTRSIVFSTRSLPCQSRPRLRSRILSPLLVACYGSLDSGDCCGPFSNLSMLHSVTFHVH